MALINIDKKFPLRKRKQGHTTNVLTIEKKVAKCNSQRNSTCVRQQGSVTVSVECDKLMTKAQDSYVSSVTDRTAPVMVCSRMFGRWRIRSDGGHPLLRLVLGNVYVSQHLGSEAFNGALNVCLNGLRGKYECCVFIRRFSEKLQLCIQLQERNCYMM